MTNNNNFPQAIFSRFQQNTALLNVKSNVNDFYSMAERVKNNRFEFPKKKPGGGKGPNLDAANSEPAKFKHKSSEQCSNIATRGE